MNPPSHSLLFHGATVVGSEFETRDDVLVRDGVVEEIDKFVEEFDEEVDVMGKLLFPGLIDCHVHFREPGLEHKADMSTESAAALAGGVTTVCEMPNTIPPTVTVAALADKIRRADALREEARNKGQETSIDMRFFFGVTQDIHLATLQELLSSTAEESIRLRSRLAGVKIYLDHSTGDQKIADQLLDDVFQACADHKLVLVAHCEDPTINAQAGAQNTRTNIAVHSLLRPAESEAAAITRAINLAKKHGTHLHIAHLSTEQGVMLVRQAKHDGITVTCEAAPHHLFLTNDDYERLGTLAKMNPPLRSMKHRFALWQGIIDGTVDCIATDHAPHTLEEKRSGEELKAPSGVPGVETMLPLLLSVAAGHWPHPFEPNASCPPFTRKDIVRLCVKNPNRIFTLGKSEIEEDHRCDIVVVDPDVEWTIKGSDLHSKCGWTPFEGWKMKGKVIRVMQAAA
jgi:dihydroorotase